MKFLASFFCGLLLSIPLLAEDVYERRDVHAVRVTQPPKIDGILDEAVWVAAPAVDTFTQRDPVEFAAPSERTEARVAFDDQALYAAIRMHDSSPDSIMAQLARHDMWTESDEIILYLDPYLDRRTGYYFGVNAAGTKYDGEFFNDLWSSDSWDGVWEGAVSRDEHGWCAELRIPFSQMRFHSKPEQTWGINFKRTLRRRNEWDYLVFKPKEGSGFVSRFWNLVGLNDIPMPSYFEVMPYASGKGSFESRDEADPFNDGSEFDPNAGVDFKIGVGSNLTLNGTANPDFGQVEVDPAVVNLSDVETYFTEKRPFFIEGANSFRFGEGGATDYWSFNWPGPSLFYSRRIGRAPQGELPDYDYVDVPEGAHILGAGKLSGKLKGNWSLGSLHAVTSSETARIEYEGDRSEVQVEPATYYTVTRAQKEIQDGFRGLGAILTGTHRFFDEDNLKADINEDAVTGGLDGWTFLDSDRVYALTAVGAMSHVRGTAERMTSLQRSSRHYFQRPDAPQVSVDSSATSLTGGAGRVLLNKEKGSMFLNTAVGAITPGFDSNDLGYQSRADVINTHFGTGYRWTEPTSWTLYNGIIGALFSTWDFGGNNTWSGIWSQWYVDWANYWSTTVNLAANPRTVSTLDTRGGPRTTNTPGWEHSFQIYTDGRKPVRLGSGIYGYRRSFADWNESVWVHGTWKPANNLSLELIPEIKWSDNWIQWVDSFEDATATHTFGSRYVFASLYQTELSASVRVNWTFTPRLSLQVYAQPLMSTGHYDEYKELAKPKIDDYLTYPEADISYDAGEDEYTIDPDGAGPAESYTFDDPDFNYQSLRGNVILRWEYALGSTLYAVWTHGRSTDITGTHFNLDRSTSGLFSTEPDNIFLVKASHWFSL